MITLLDKWCRTGQILFMDESFLEALAKPESVPAGGPAAANGASVRVALLEKIVRVELQRQPIDSKLQSFWQKMLEQVFSLAKTLIQLRVYCRRSCSH